MRTDDLNPDDVCMSIRDPICQSVLRLLADGNIEILSEHPGVRIREFAERPNPLQLRCIAEWCSIQSGDFTVANADHVPASPHVIIAEDSSPAEVAKCLSNLVTILGAASIQAEGGYQWDEVDRNTPLSLEDVRFLAQDIAKLRSRAMGLVRRLQP